MATTGFWPVKGRLKDVLEYADNPDKTTNPEYLDSDLYAALKYAENGEKTDKQLFVSGINCAGSSAYSQMMAVKKKFGERGSVVAYHGYQSFEAEEVTPEEAHAIGVETARRMWGDKYQVIVTTHLNTENLHNHFVVNSTSFKDGTKFRNKIGDHMELRKVSDAVCKEYGKSVLENSDFYKHGKKEYWSNKDGQKTHREQLREDLEYCLTYASSWDKFILQLHGLGYEIDLSRMSVKAKGWERAVRLGRLGYTEQVINDRLEKNFDSNDSIWKWNRHLPYQPKQFPIEHQIMEMGLDNSFWEMSIPGYRRRDSRELEFQKNRLVFTIEHSHNSAVILVDAIFLLFITAVELVRELSDVMFISPDLRHAANDINQYVNDYHFLKENGIHTLEQLKSYTSETRKQISDLEQERSKADNARRRARIPEEKQEAKDKRAEITKQISPLRKELSHAEKIMEKSPKLYEMLKQEHSMEKAAQERNRMRERSR